MLPTVITDLIFAYLEAMNEYTDLPPLNSVKRLVKRSDSFVMNTLGFVLGMPVPDLIRLRYRVLLDNDFVFYFRLSFTQRNRLIHLLKNGIVGHRATACLVWIMLMGPNLLRHQEYKDIFMRSLLIKLLRHFNATSTIGV